jgi:hypothetical protein
MMKGGTKRQKRKWKGSEVGAMYKMGMKPVWLETHH